MGIFSASLVMDVRALCEPGESRRPRPAMRAGPASVVARPFLAFAATLFLVSCSGTPATRASSETRVASASPARAIGTAAGTTRAAAGPIDGALSDYLIGPGDTLRVVVSQNPDLNADVPVRPDGKISTPLASDVVAVGKTHTQLARDIEKVLVRYVRAPSVSVIVTNPIGAFGQVRVVGKGVVAPKGFPYRSGMTVLDLVLQSGGLSEFAAGNRAKIIRTDKKGTREIRVRLDDLLDKGKVSQNIQLEPGDILVVPEAWF